MFPVWKVLTKPQLLTRLETIKLKKGKCLPRAIVADLVGPALSSSGVSTAVVSREAHITWPKGSFWWWEPTQLLCSEQARSWRIHIPGSSSQPMTDGSWCINTSAPLSPTPWRRPMSVLGPGVPTKDEALLAPNGNLLDSASLVDSSRS